MPAPAQRQRSTAGTKNDASEKSFRGRTDEVVDPDVHRDAQLRADAVGPAHEHGVLVSGGLEVEDASEAANLGVGAWPAGRADVRLAGNELGLRLCSGRDD